MELVSFLSPRKKMNSKDRWNALSSVLFIILVIYGIIMVGLLFWGVITSLKTQDDFLMNKLGFPNIKKFGLQGLENFQKLFAEFKVDTFDDYGYPLEINIGWMIVYTLLYTIGCGIVQTIVPCIVAYACVKYPGKVASLIYWIVIITMMIPIVGSYASELDILQRLGIYNHIWGVMIQKAHFLGMYYLVFYAAFKGISPSFYEAAEIDGASEMRMMFTIALPLVKKLIMTVFLIQFIGLWNDYQTPLLYIPSYPTLSYGLYSVTHSTTNALNTVPVRMAGCAMIVVPILCLYVAFSERIMGNVTMGGVKE